MSVRILKDTKFSGIAALAKRLQAGNHQVMVGVPKTAPEAEHGMPMATLAAIHEFGGFVKPHSRVKGQTMWFHPRTGRILSRRVRAGGKYPLKFVLETKAKPATFANGITIPERPFLRVGIRRNLEFFARLSRANLVRLARGQITMAVALGQLGAAAAGKVQKEISDGHFTPNAPSTIRAKGSSKPLVDTGALRQAITWTVEQGGGDTPVAAVGGAR